MNESTEKSIVSRGGGTTPAWSADGRQIYYISPERKMMSIPVSPGTLFDAGCRSRSSICMCAKSARWFDTDNMRHSRRVQISPESVRRRGRHTALDVHSELVIATGEPMTVSPTSASRTGVKRPSDITPPKRAGRFELRPCLPATVFDPATRLTANPSVFCRCRT